MSISKEILKSPDKIRSLFNQRHGVYTDKPRDRQPMADHYEIDTTGMNDTEIDAAIKVANDNE